MCGIAGIFNWGDRAVLERMTDIQAHRGPNDRGIWEARLSQGWVGLGSRRLSILDLSPAGHMPMTTPEEDIWITYNGQIYNHLQLRSELESKGYRFRSRTDTEVLLYLYREEGPEFVKRLNGMFAIAIVDLRKSPMLFLARDHFGIKPLYYTSSKTGFAFASEAKALLELPGLHREINAEALHQYMTFLWVPEPLTLLNGIFKLLAGHYAIYEGDGLKVRKYWDLTFPPADYQFPLSEKDLVHEIRDRFCYAVESQLMSDVPVGAFLSAGLDSGGIVAAMARSGKKPLRTYTITFASQHLIGESSLDDPSVASRLAQRLGSNHTEIQVDPDAVSLLPKLIWHMDDPVADPAIILAYLVCREARKSSTVLLSGIGGDEIFGGYRKYLAARMARFYKFLPSLLRKGLLDPALRALPSMRQTPLKDYARLARKWGRSASLGFPGQFLMDSTYLDAHEKMQLYSAELRQATAGMNPLMRHQQILDQASHADCLNQMLYADSKLFMNSLNLNYNDKMSMAASVEVRVPFLDKELVDWTSWNVPSYLKVNGVTTKYIFRRAMDGLLPAEVLSQPKASFRAPIDFYLTHDLREMVDDLLSEQAVRRRGYFSPSFVRHMVSEHRSGHSDWAMPVWQLLTLELWFQCFLDHPKKAAVSETVTAEP